MLRYIVAGCTALTLIFAGCSRDTEPEEKPPAITLLYQDVRNAHEAGDIDGALALLEKAMQNEEFAQDRPGIFNTMISIELGNDRAQEAMDQYLSMTSESTEVAEYSLGMMLQHLQASPDTSALLAFTEKMLEVPFSDSAKGSIHTVHACALIANNRTDEALELVGRLRESSMSAQVYRSIVSSLISTGNKEEASLVIDKIASVAGGDAEMLELVTLSRLDLLANSGNWNDFISLLTKDIASLSERGAYYALNVAIRGINQNSNAADLDRVCWVVIDSRGPAEQCVISAANQCLKLSMQSDPAAIPECARKLAAKNIPANRLVAYIQKPFYTVLSSDNQEKLREMIDIVSKLTAGLTEEADKSLANSMLLDGSFILNDYDTAISMIETGVPGRDENWHRSALVKVKAHKALDSGNTDEAVKYFREFMDVIEDTMTRETDPSSGMTYTAQWCLGRNAKRIGDLLKEAGKKEPAADAYKEAKEHFDKALGEFPDDSKERAAISSEMSEIPQTL